MFRYRRMGAIVLGAIVALAVTSPPCAPVFAQEELAAADFKDTVWKLHYDWTKGPSGDVVIKFRKNGTFWTSQECGGRWFAVGNKITFAFYGDGCVPCWSCVYSASRAGDKFSGTQGWTHADGHRTGTHDAKKLK